MTLAPELEEPIGHAEDDGNHMRRSRGRAETGRVPCGCDFECSLDVRKLYLRNSLGNPWGTSEDSLGIRWGSL